MKLSPLRKISPWRAISLVSWKPLADSSVVAIEELNAAAILPELSAWNAANNGQNKATLTHWVLYCLAQTFGGHPEVNQIVRFGNLYPRKDLNFSVMVSQTGDLTAISAKAVDRWSFSDWVNRISEEAQAVRKESKKDRFRWVREWTSKLPGPFRWLAVWSVDFILHTLNLWSPALGVPQDGFGSIMVTSLGALGMPFGIARIYPQARSVMMISIGVVEPAPMVKGDRVVVGQRIRIVFTVDHRVLDGFHGGYLLSKFRETFLNPDGINGTSSR